MNSLRKLFLVVISCLLVFSAFAEEGGFLADLITESLENNPKLKALENQWQSKKAIILSAKTIPQPEFGYGHFGESMQTKTGPLKRKFSIKQAIPFPTKLSTKGKIAKKEAEIAYARYILGIRGIIEQLKSYFYDYYFIDRSIQILEEEKLISESMRKSVQRKYETLKVPQQDLVKSDLEISKIEDRILNLKSQRNLLQTQINRILNRPQFEKLAIPAGYLPSVDEFKTDKKILIEKALDESPHILLDKLGLAKEDYKTSLAKQGYIPDFNIMAEYIEIGEGTTKLSQDGQDAWMIGLGVRVPLWFWKVRSEVKSAEFRRDAQAYSFEDKENFLLFKVEDLFFKIKTEEQLVDLYENIILPQALHNFSVSGTGYENGTVDFLNWLDAERNLISIKIAKLKQVVDYKKIIAQLEYIIGEDL